MRSAAFQRRAQHDLITRLEFMLSQRVLCHVVTVHHNEVLCVVGQADVGRERTWARAIGNHITAAIEFRTVVWQVVQQMPDQFD